MKKDPANDLYWIELVACWQRQWWWWQYIKLCKVTPLRSLHYIIYLNTNPTDMPCTKIFVVRWLHSLLIYFSFRLSPMFPATNKHKLHKRSKRSASLKLLTWKTNITKWKFYNFHSNERSNCQELTVSESLFQGITNNIPN